MLTDLKLKSLDKPGRYLAGGEKGLYVQVSLGKDGSPRKSFVYRYKFGGKAREMGRISGDQPQRGQRQG
jgi:hypothetical protein